MPFQAEPPDAPSGSSEKQKSAVTVCGDGAFGTPNWIRTSGLPLRSMLQGLFNKYG